MLEQRLGHRTEGRCRWSWHHQPGRRLRGSRRRSQRVLICDGVPDHARLLVGSRTRCHVYHVDVRSGRQLHHERDEPAASPRQYTMMALRSIDQAPTLPESQAGSAYYWHVDGLRRQRLHAISGVTQSTAAGLGGIPQGFACRRWADHERPQRQRDHLLAGRTTTTPTSTPCGAAEAGNQTAKSYRIQVSPDPSFSTITDQRDRRPGHRTRPMTGCTPMGPTSGGCRPSTIEDQGLTGRAVQTFTKVESARHAVLAGRWSGRSRARRPFRWSPRPFAASYTVEVYQQQRPHLQRRQPDLQRDGEDHGLRPPHPDSRFGNALRVAGPAARTSAGNPGPWSARRRSSRPASAPNLLTPQGRDLREVDECATSSGPRCRVRRRTR